MARFYTVVHERMRDATLVTDPGLLEAAVFRLHGARRVAVDTEFMRESTYRAQLCLVQVASDADCCLVDPLAVPDLGTLHATLCDPGVLKILHAARQDLEVLLQAAGRVPGPVFDTQVAAALLGLPPQVGYAELVARRLGHSIDKGQTRTDWSRRPLSPAQLAYAADDVRHLLELHDDLTAALAAKDRKAWLEEDCAALADPSLYRTDSADAWRRLKGLGRLRPAEQAVACALAAWREQRAIESDRPRGWILADEALYALATQAPTSRADLESVPALAPGTARKRGDELLALIADARRSAGATPVVPPTQRPTPEQTRLVAALQQQVRTVATELEMSPEVLATRRDVEALAFGSGAEPGVLRGWRRTVIGERLLAMLL